LVTTGCGETAVRLSNNWGELVKCFPILGRVMALTRNEHAVYERQGTYRKARVVGDSCCVRVEEAELQFSLAHWHCGFAVCDSPGLGSRFSLQFFGRKVSAVHKITLTDDSDPAAYHRLTRTYRGLDQGTAQDAARVLPEPGSKPDAQVDVAGLRAHWDQLTDSYALLALVGQFGVTRL
jgi:putative hemin transport protein